MTPDPLPSEAHWKMTLEYTSFDGSTKKTVTLQQTDHWVNDGNWRPAMQCVALELSYLCQMLQASGIIIGASSTSEDLIDAFADGWVE